MSASTILPPLQPSSLSTAQLAAVSFLARYSGRTHRLYTYQLKRWFTWCEGNRLDPAAGCAAPVPSPDNPESDLDLLRTSGDTRATRNADH